MLTLQWMLWLGLACLDAICEGVSRGVSTRMTRIRIVRDKRDPGRGRLYLDGRRAKCTSLFYGERGWALETRDSQVRDSILAIPLNELRLNLVHLCFRVNDRCHPFINDCMIGLHEKEVRVEFGSTCGLDSWRQPYTIVDFCRAIKRVSVSLKQTGIRDTTYKEHDDYFCTLSFRAANPAGPLLDEFTRRAEIVREVIDQALEQVCAEIEPESLAVYFRFPKEIRSACAQYLLYFQQFLSDLGINARAEIKEEAHRLLFTVTPTSGKEALLWVKDALTAYLQLPSLTESCSTLANSVDVAVLQLDNNVQHLRTQLAMSCHVVAAQNVTMRLPHLIEFTCEEGTSLGLSRASAKASSQRRRDGGDESEALIPNFLSVTRFRIGPLELNLPGLLRALKRIWNRGSTN